MPKIKVIELLKSFSLEEMRQMDKFVKSPAFNRHEKVSLLFAYLRKQLQRGTKHISGEKIFKHLFPGEALKMQKVHHVSSYLLKVVEEFLAWKEWRGDEMGFHLSLLQSYRRLQQPTFFYRELGSTLKTHKKSILKNSKYYEQGYKMESLRFAQMRTDSKNKDFRLQELSGAQDTAFIIEKLKIACILLSNQAVTKKTYDMGMVPFVQQYVERSNLLDNPTLAIYYYASKALSNFTDDPSYQELKKLLLKYPQNFNINELYDIHIFAINYCIRKLNNGEQQFMREVFDIYKSGIETNIFLEKGMLAPRTYSNIVMAGLKLGEFAFIQSFIYDYKDKLPEKEREGFFNYNLARFYFEKNDYSRAMPLLLLMEYDDVLLTSQGKILLAQMYFEQKEMDALTSLLQSLSIYIKRKKMIGYHSISYLNFTNLLNKLIHIKNIKSA
ncbi:MAG TPA: hypothetical protein ENJ95_16660, partial [Bacteroidetes bacterium]|nr:hypothetical protein [Bacteroidota bacterium]